MLPQRPSKKAKVRVKLAKIRLRQVNRAQNNQSATRTPLEAAVVGGSAAAVLGKMLK